MFEALWVRLRPGGGPEFGVFGRDLETATRSEFFGFFNLVEAGRTRTGGREKVVFHAASPEMAPLARVQISLAGGRIAEMELRVRRSFVEDPRLFPFAADITASFIRGAVEAPAAAQAAGEIGRYQPPGAAARVLVRSAALAPSPQLGGSPQASVYAGRAAEAGAGFGGLRLVMVNTDADGAPWLAVRVTPS